jgi:hypothetical protein
VSLVFALEKLDQNLKKLPKVNNRPIGETSPNLVTLIFRPTCRDDE